MSVAAHLARCLPLRASARLSRPAMAGCAVGTVAFFAAVGGPPNELTHTVSTLLPMLIAVIVAVRPARRSVEPWLTVPYVVLGLAAVAIDALLLTRGTPTAMLVGVLPAAGGLVSWWWPRPHPTAEMEAR